MIKNLLALSLVLFLASGAFAGSWAMDDNSASVGVWDSSVDGLHATMVDPTGNPATNAHHSADRMEGTGSLYLDGVDDYIQMPTNAGIEVGDAVTGNLWASCWFKSDLTEAPTSSTTLMGTGDGGWFIGNFGDGATGLEYVAWVLTDSGGGYTEIVSNHTVPVWDNQWHYVETMFDSANATMSISIDGSNVTAGIHTENPNIRGDIFGNPVLVGENAGATGRYFGGLVDDVVIEAVPEPATMLMLGLGGIALIRKKR